MSKLERALTELRGLYGGSRGSALTPLCQLLLTLIYLIAMLSVGPTALTRLLWFAVFPIVGAALSGINYSKIFTRSLVVLPFVAIIGIFNPVLDTHPAFCIGSVVISQGWVSYASIILRTLLSVQALLLLMENVGFSGICRTMRKVGIPKFLTVQLMMVYRYLTVLLEEALDMRRAREARGYLRPMSLRMWGAFIGQLLLRSLDRADRIHRAMLARGFNGEIPESTSDINHWHPKDTIALLAGGVLCLLFRIINISALLGFTQFF